MHGFPRPPHIYGLVYHVTKVILFNLLKTEIRLTLKMVYFCSKMSPTVKMKLFILRESEFTKVKTNYLYSGSQSLQW